MNNLDGEGGCEGGVRHGLGTKRRKKEGSRCWESEATKEGRSKVELDEESLGLRPFVTTSFVVFAIDREFLTYDVKVSLMYYQEDL